MSQLDRDSLRAKKNKKIFKNNRRLIDAIGLGGFLDDLIDSLFNLIDDAGSGGQVNSDWNATSGVAEILNKPSTFTPSAHTHSTSAITGLDAALAQKGELDGVAPAGDTLKKLYDLIVATFSEVTVANIAARNAYNVTNLPTNIFVLDDGDGNWALYKATTTGVGATFVKLSDPDLLNAVLTASQIKISYESNSDTNAFTNAFKAMLDSVPVNTIKGRITSGTGNVEDLTGTQATTLLDVFTSTLKGLVPASGGGTVNYLRADGTFQNPLPSVTEVGGTSTLNTTSVTDVALTGITLTPGDGTFLAMFSCTGYNNGTPAGYIEVSLYVNGTQVATSVRRNTNGGNTNASSLQGVIAFQEKVTVTAGQVIDVRWRVNGATGTIIQRKLTLIPCQ